MGKMVISLVENNSEKVFYLFFIWSKKLNQKSISINIREKGHDFILFFCYAAQPLFCSTLLLKLLEVFHACSEHGLICVSVVLPLDVMSFPVWSARPLVLCHFLSPSLSLSLKLSLKQKLFFCSGLAQEAAHPSCVSLGPFRKTHFRPALLFI